MDIASVPATFTIDAMGSLVQAVTFTIPSGNWTAATWNRTLTQTSHGVADTITTPGSGIHAVNWPTHGTGTFSDTATASADQIADINAAAGGTLNANYNSGDVVNNESITLLTLTLTGTPGPSPEVDIRFYDSAGKRKNVPANVTVQADCEIIERGGCGAGNLRLLAAWDDLTLAGNERVDIRLFGVLVYRGWIRTPQNQLENPESLALSCYGLMQILDGYQVRRRYVYGSPVDISTVFSDIVTDYVDVAGRLPDIVLDAQDVDVTIQTFDAVGKSVAAAFNALCDLAPNLAIWGADVDNTYADRLYIRPRATAVAQRYSVGGAVSAFVYPLDVSGIINRIFIRGGSVAQPNLLTNPSFEEPAPNSETVGNLIGDYSFETGTGWTLVGGATIQDSGSGLIENQTARTGAKVLEIDTPNEEANITVDIDYKIPYVASCYARRESANIAADVKIQVDGLDSGGTPVTGATVNTGFLDPGTIAWKQFTQAVDFSAYATVSKAKVRYITSQGSEGATGTLVDDTGLWEANGIANSGWKYSLAGNAKRAILDWIHHAVTPYHGGYCVKVQTTGISVVTDYLEIRTQQNARARVNAGTLYTLVVFLRGDGSNNLSCSIGVVEYKGDGTVQTTTESATTTANYAAWTIKTLQVTMNALTQTVEVFLRVRNNNLIYIDAFGLLEGNLPADWNANGFWAGSEYERVYDVTNTPATERNPLSGISTTADDSITNYGQREAEVSNENVTDWGTAIAFAVGYLNAQAVPKVQAQLRCSLASADDLLDMTGTVKLLNLPTAPAALFPARVHYVIGERLEMEADLGNQRPELAQLLRLLESKNRLN